MDGRINFKWQNSLTTLQYFQNDTSCKPKWYLHYKGHTTENERYELLKPHQTGILNPFISSLVTRNCVLKTMPLYWFATWKKHEYSSTVLCCIKNVFYSLYSREQCFSRSRKSKPHINTMYPILVKAWIIRWPTLCLLQLTVHAKFKVLQHCNWSRVGTCNSVLINIRINVHI